MLVETKHNNVFFKQKPWLNRYIDFNTNKKALAENYFEKELLKTIACSFFGKTMENVTDRVNIDFI